MGFMRYECPSTWGTPARNSPLPARSMKGVKAPAEDMMMRLFARSADSDFPGLSEAEPSSVQAKTASESGGNR